MIGYINWNIAPEIFNIGPLEVRWYGLMFASAFFFGYITMGKYFKKESLSATMLDKLSMYVFLGTLIGARLGHILFYQLDFYVSNPGEILKVWHGGLASHGAAIGILISIFLFAKKSKIPILFLLDRLVIVVALGGFFIRLGNLFNSEIYGIETTLPWGFIFVRAGETVAKHPTQLYEASVAIVLFLGLNKLLISRGKMLPSGTIFGVFLVTLFTMRFLIEFLKENQVEREADMLLNMGQWLSIPFVLFGVILLLYIYRANNGFVIDNIKANR